MVRAILEFKKRDFLWVVPLVLVLVIGFGVAINSGDYAVQGHDLGELDMPDCLEGQVIVKTAGGWGCDVMPSGSGSGSSGGSGSLECRRKSSTSSSGTLCCDADEIVMSSVQDDQNNNVWLTTTTNPQCVGYANMNAGDIDILCCDKDVGVAGTLEQMTKFCSSSGTCTVSCDTGWTRSGCSGGRFAGSDNDPVNPVGASGCECVDTNCKAYVHCMRLT